MNKIFVCQVDELDEGEALKVDCGVNGIEAGQAGGVVVEQGALQGGVVGDG